MERRSHVDGRLAERRSASRRRCGREDLAERVGYTQCGEQVAKLGTGCVQVTLEVIEARNVVEPSAGGGGDTELLADVVDVLGRGVHVENVDRNAVRIATETVGGVSPIRAVRGQGEISDARVDLAGNPVRLARRVIPSVDTAVRVAFFDVYAASGEARRQQATGRGVVDRPRRAAPLDEAYCSRRSG